MAEVPGLLTATVFLPLAVAIVIALFGRRVVVVRVLAGAAVLADFALAVAVFALYDRGEGGFQLVDRIADWIPVESFQVQYFLGVDGLSAPMVLLTGLLGMVAVFGSWSVSHRVREYFVWLLALQTAVMGVFTSLDLLLFFLFWELELVPMYMLISIWGSGRKEYSAMKFLIFTILGSAFMDAMDIFEPAGIELVPVVHEQGAAHMADGFSRVSGRHGVVIGQNGPGISNCVTAVAAAFWAHSPVVIVTPEAGTMGIGLGGFQEANQLPMFEEFTKYQGHVNNEHRMAELTARCFDRAQSEMGPTQLNIPRDRFYGDIDVEIPRPQRLDRGPGGDRTLNEAAELLAGASFPVMISGGEW